MRTEHAILLASAPFVGSFLGVVADRLPIGESALFGRSRCRRCAHVLGPRDLVPLLSWLASRGRCRHCASPVGAFHPAIELAALAVAAYAVALLPGWLAFAGCGLGWTLLTLAVIDNRHFLLPDALTLSLIPAGLAVTWLGQPAHLPDHVAGAAIGLALFLAVAWLYRNLRGREGLGMGDAKLLAGAGAWVAWQGLPSVVLLAAASGLCLVIGRRLAGRRLDLGERIAFGPHLCLGAWFVWLHGPIAIG